MRKKILFVAESLQTNGAMMSLLGLLNALSPDEYAISFFCFDHTGPLMARVPQYVRILPELPSYRVFFQYKNDAIKWALRHFRVDLVLYRLCVWLERGLRIIPFLWRLLPCVKGDWDVVCGYADGLVSKIVVGKFSGKKVLWVHENYEDTKPGNSIKKAFAVADGIACVSHDAIGHLEAWFGRSVGDKVHVVHNVTDPARCVRLANENVGEISDMAVLVSVGRISPEKGYDLVPGIVQILKARGVVFRWLIVGGGILEIENLLNGVECVELLGRKSNPYPYIKKGKLLVSLSRAEGWGMNVSEALALHKPVVCSDIPVYREQVKNGINGFCVKRTPEAFASAIEKLLKDDSLREKMGAAANCEMCSPNSVRNEFAAMIKSLEDTK